MKQITWDVNMTEIVQGLFGVSPEQLQMQQNQALQARAMQYAQMSPQEQATSAIYTGVSKLGGALGGMLGGVDPVQQQASKIASVLQGADQTTAEGMAAIAQRFSDAGLPQQAQMAVAKAQAMKKEAAALGLTAAQTEAQKASAAKETKLSVPPDILKAQREAALKQGLRALEGNTDPEVNNTRRILQDELDALTRGKEAAASELATLFAEQAKLDPVKDKAKFDAYAAKIKKLTTGKTMGEEIGSGVAAGLGILGAALAPALKKEGEATGDFAAKDFNTLGSAVAAGTASKRNVKILKDNLDQAFTGSFSDVKKNISSALIGLNLPIGNDIKNAVSSTELINAMGTRYVFPLVKNFPGSLAAKELDRLEKTAPNTLQQPETVKRLVSLLEADIAENEFTYGKAKQYKADKKSLIGFNQADNKIEFQQKYNQLQDLVSAVRARKSQTSSEASQINTLRKELGL